MCFGANASGVFTQLLLIAPRYSGLISSISYGFTYAVNGISATFISAIVKHVKNFRKIMVFPSD